MVDNLLLAAQINILWHLPPLAAVISLVYSASRFEQPARIIQRAIRLFATIMVFMGAVFVLLTLMSAGL